MNNELLRSRAATPGEAATPKTETTALPRCAVVTGGGRGIGRAIVERLASQGYDVAFNYASDDANAAQLCERVNAMGVRCYAVRCDVGEPSSVADFFAEVERHFDHIDVLINNAGVTRDGLLASLALNDIHTVLQTNLLGTILCTQRVVPAMMTRRKGCIINISSVAAQRPGKGQSIYAASKGALESFTRALAVELSPRGIRVNAVAPGVVETEMSANFAEAMREQLIERLLIKRLARADEIADAVLFLVTQGTYMSGEVLPVNGGLKMV